MTTRRTTRPRLEGLEDRLTPAGNVTAVLSGPDLIVTGDALSNSLRVTQNAANDIVLTGLAGTTVNGRPAVVLRGSLVKADFALGAGNDVLDIRSLRVSNDLSVELGDGNDAVALTAPRVGGNLTLKGGLGDDRFSGNGLSVGIDANIEGEGGRSTVSFINSSFGALTVATKDAADSIRLSGLRVAKDLSVEAGKGDDVLSLSNLSVGLALTLIADEGNDRVRLSGVSAGEDVSVEAGKGDDAIALTRVSSGSVLAVNADDGTDRVTVRTASAGTDAVFTGGAGFDVLDDVGLTAGIKIDVKEFESRI